MNIENVENKEFGMNPPIEETSIAEAAGADACQVAEGPTEDVAVTQGTAFDGATGNYIRPKELACCITEELNKKMLVPGTLFKKIMESIEEKLKEHENKTIGKPIRAYRNWDKAREELENAMEEYAKLGAAGMYGIKGLTPLMVRLNKGERTSDLFNAILSAVR